ncbi:MAG: hypothetical protein Q7K47_06670 [Fusobacterium sp. JB019]|nr:hypothetical protein [Fusobacterium sp. JB019]
MINLFKRNKNKEGEKIETVHPFYYLLIILIIVLIVSNIIPSGQYERFIKDGRTIVDPTTFKFIGKTHVGFVDFMQSFYFGFKAIAGLVALILFCGGAFGIANEINLLENLLKAIYKRVKHFNFTLFVYLLMLIFGLFTSFTGFYDLICIVFIPIVVPLTLALGYDVLTGVAILMVSSCIGHGTAMASPFFTAIAHTIAELPIFSALWYRGLSFVVLLIPATLYIVKYANGVKNNPSKSLLYGMDLGYEALDEDVEVKMSPALKRAAVPFVGSFIFLIYGSVKLNFGYADMTGTFVAMGFLTALAYGMSLNDYCKYLAKGMTVMFIPTMVMIYARAILYLLEQSNTIDTIIMFFGNFISGGSGYLSATMMFVVQSLINLIIPSGSGQALVTMPMIIPLADMANIPRQVACLASQFGDGFSNFIWPTCGSLLAILAIAKVPYTKWVKFFAPLFLIITLSSFALIWIAIAIGLGPF